MDDHSGGHKWPVDGRGAGLGQSWGVIGGEMAVPTKTRKAHGRGGGVAPPSWDASVAQMLVETASAMRSRLGSAEGPTTT